MKNKQLLILGVTLVVAAVAAFLISRNRTASLSGDTSSGNKLFPEFPLNDIASFVITSSDGEVQVSKTDSRWTVAQRENYPADFGRVQRFLRNLWKTKIIQGQTIGESQLGRMQLRKPSGEGSNDELATLVSFQDKDGKELRRLRIGKSVTNESGAPSPSPFGGGGTTSRYLMTNLASDQVLEVNDEFERVSGELDISPASFREIKPKPGDWLHKSFIDVSKVKSVAVSFKEEGKAGWTLSREKEDGDFVLGDSADDQELDSTKTGTYKNLLSKPSFKDVLTKEKTEELDLSKAAEATVDTFEGFTYKLILGPKDDATSTIATKFEISGEFPTERTVEERTEESEEDKKTKDEAFAASRKALEAKLDNEKKVENRFYLVNSWNVDSLLKAREELLKKEEEEEENETTPAGLGTAPSTTVPSFPGAPSDPARNRVIEAVTPPVAVPPLDKDGTKGKVIEAVTPPIPVPPIPPKSEETPAAPEGTPAAPEETPAAPEETPAEPEGTPAAPEGTPAAPEETPAAPEETPAEPEGTPAEPEGTPAAPEGAPEPKEGSSGG